MFLSQRKSFDFGLLFGSLSTLKLITGPLLGVLQNFYALSSGMASIGRIERHLKLTPLSTKSSNTTQDSTSTAPTQPSNQLFKLKDAKFTSQTGKVLLHDINLIISSCELIIVTGRVGSGKSLLLLALLGELQLETGVSNISTYRLAFCGQTHFLRKSIIRQNILAGRALDEDWYKTVVSACALSHDFDSFAQRDLTEI
jgi:ABC-type multidrug transport system fused ATPase/permease subunit